MDWRGIMKKNSGSALTSVIVVFLLVTMIGVPLLGMVVYNYRLREYDSGIKEAEYKNEIIMDRISTIIKNEVIAAISDAKNTATDEIKTISSTLVNSYNSAYQEAMDTTAKYTNGNLNNASDVTNELKEKIKKNIVSVDGVDEDEIIKALDIDDTADFSSAKINEEGLNNVCNRIFEHNYENILENSLFDAIYNDNEFKDLAGSRKYGIEELEIDETTKKVKAGSLKIEIQYNRNGDKFTEIYAKNYDDEKDGNGATFNDIDNTLEIRVESKYKLNDRVPLTTLGATFVIEVPDFDTISSIEQQTIALSNPVLDYGLIAGGKLELNNGAQVKVDGSILTRTDDKKNDDGIVINSGSSLKSVKKSDNEVAGDGRIATSGDIIMHGNTTLETGTNPIYYRNLYLGKLDKQEAGTINVTFNGDVLAKDDLEVNSNGTVNVKQTAGKNYFGYNDMNNEGPDSSSAIVINSADISGIEIGLGNLYLAGRAFIDGVKSTTRLDKQKNPMIYKTGESISVKGNYIAYQSPLFGTENNKYDVNKVKFSPYFMTGQKSGIDTDTNLTVNLVDNFAEAADDYYDTFDSSDKWKYFVDYAKSNTIKMPNIIIGNVEYIQGAGLNRGGVVSQSTGASKQAEMNNLGARFEEFTSYFGYFPKEEANRKSNIKDWIKFGTSEKRVQNGNFFVYISKTNAGSKTLGWGTSVSGVDIPINVDSGSEVNGIVIHDGDLTIKKCDLEIPFNGIIIVTGDLTIESSVNIYSDKETTANTIIQNYLGASNYVYTSGTEGSSGTLAEGELFQSFAYDHSGTTYVVIDVSDRSNLIDINELIGIKEWKKTSGII